MSVQASSWAWQQKGLSHAVKMTLLALADISDTGGQCWPKRKTLAEMLECSVDTIDRHLRELMSLGLIEKEHRYAESGSLTSNQYRLAMAVDPGRKNAATPRRKIAPPQPHIDAATSPHSSAATLAAYGAAVIEPLIEPSLNTSSFPLQEEPSKNPPRVDWQARLAEAHSIAAGTASMANGGTCHPAAFRRLCEPSVGTPCDWDLDVIPAIASKAAAAKKRNKPILDWSWVSDQAVENRDRRLAGLPAPDAQPVRIEGRRKETAAEKAERLFAKMEGTAA
jgi:hypothetical protein